MHSKPTDNVVTTPFYVNRLIKKSNHIVNKTFIRVPESFGYDIELTYVQKDNGAK